MARASESKDRRRFRKPPGCSRGSCSQSVSVHITTGARHHKILSHMVREGVRNESELCTSKAEETATRYHNVHYLQRKMEHDKVWYLCYASLAKSQPSNHPLYGSA